MSCEIEVRNRLEYLNESIHSNNVSKEDGIWCYKVINSLLMDNYLLRSKIDNLIGEGDE